MRHSNGRLAACFSPARGAKVARNGRSLTVAALIRRNVLAAALLLAALRPLACGAAEPAAAATREAVVAADGSGQFISVQAAINAAPQDASAAQPWIIRIKPGTYKERVYVQREKHFVQLVGEDAAKTVITFSLYASMSGPDGQPIGTFRTPTVQIDADDFSLEGLTLENSAGPQGQALALRVDGDRVTFRHCRFVGWQDTILGNRGRHYFEDCTIVGATDFIFGAATEFYENCRIHCAGSGYITAASTSQEQPYGLVFSHCTVTAETPELKTYLGRPWRAYASVTWLNTELPAQIRPAGWDNWRDPAREQTARFAEFASTGPGANPAARVTWSRQLTSDQAAAITRQAVLGGSDGWDPVGSATTDAPPATTRSSTSASDAASSAATTPSVELPVIPAKAFPITDFGAVGDGKTICTAALQQAINACHQAGGGRVVVPAGTFVTGPIELCGNMALALESGATLRGSANFADYVISKTAEHETVHNEFDSLVRPLISGARLTNVAIEGAGTIDGGGQPWWDRARAESAAGAAAQGDSRKGAAKSSPRPRMVLLTDCRQIHICGVALKDSPNFHIALSRCQEVLIEDLTITAPAHSPNTDGIDPGNCRNVVIRRCTIGVGDDNVALKSNRGGPPLENVLVSDCTFKHGHGASIGSNVGAGVRHITVQNCTFDGTVTAIRIKSARDRGAVVEDVTYCDLVIKDVNTALAINLFYFDKKGQSADTAEPITNTTPIVRHVRIANVKVTSAVKAGEIIGLPEAPVSDVVLENVQITADKGMQIRHAKGIVFQQSELHIAAGVPLVVHDAEVTGIKTAEGK